MNASGATGGRHLRSTPYGAARPTWSSLRANLGAKLTTRFSTALGRRRPTRTIWDDQLTHADGKPAIRRLRQPDEVATAYGHAINIGLEGIRVALEKYRPNEREEYYRWYREAVSPAYVRLTEL